MLRILWLDNDVAQTEPYVYELHRRGHDVTVIKRIAECERLLERQNEAARYDLLVLDVMIPTKDAKEEERYTPDSTDRGNITGLAFWNQWKNRLQEMNIRVLVLTVRLDKAIKERFVEAGLPRDAFATKVQLRDADEFAKRIELIGGRQ